MRKVMMKIAAMAMVLAMVFTFAGCDILNFKLGDILPGGRNPVEGNVMSPEMAGNDFAFDATPDMETAPVEEAEPEEVPAEERSVSDFMELLEFLNTAFEETYGAQVNWDQTYSRIFENEEASMAGEDPVEIRAGFHDYDVTHDALMASLYPVTNVDSLDHWREHISQYLSAQMVEKWSAEQDVLVEYGGKLYMMRAGRGYGAWLLELETAKFVSQGNDACSIAVNCYAFGEYECTYQVDFVLSGGNWIIDNYYTI